MSLDYKFKAGQHITW